LLRKEREVCGRGISVRARGGVVRSRACVKRNASVLECVLVCDSKAAPRGNVILWV